MPSGQGLKEGLGGGACFSAAHLHQQETDPEPPGLLLGPPPLCEGPASPAGLWGVAGTDSAWILGVPRAGVVCITACFRSRRVPGLVSKGGTWDEGRPRSQSAPAARGALSVFDLGEP